MKIIFVSGVKFGYELLKYLLERNWNFEAVISYDNSKRKLFSDMVSFDDLTSQYKIKHIKVKNINEKENVKIIKEISPDLILVLGWSQILKNEILKIPTIGIIGSHPTELPKFRGRAPIPWSIIKNIKQSALTFFWIEEGTDTGSILDQQKFIISEEDDATSIYEKIIQLGKNMILKNLELLAKGKIIKIKQDESKFIENWPKRTPEDGKIDWSKPAKEIQTLIRATTHPYPGAFTFFKDTKLIVWKSSIIKEDLAVPGKIMSIDGNGVKIGTGNDAVKLTSISYGDDQKNNFKEIFTENDIGDVLG